MRLLVAGLFILAALVVPGAAPPRTEYPLPHALDPAPSAGFEEFAFLGSLLKGKRVVQLGENGHGTREATLARARLVRYLHQELGFNVLALESSLFLGYRGDEGASTEDPRNTLLASTIGVWHTQEMLPLFEFVRDTRATKKPLRLAGFDIQPIGSAKKHRPAFFERIVAAADASYAAEVLAFDRTFVEEYDKGSASRRRYLREHRDSLVAGYERLAGFLERNRAKLQRRAGRQAPLVARQEALAMAAYVRQQSATDTKDYAELRDRAMADNVTFLVDELFPGEKVIVWGHNYHVRLDNVSIPPREEIFPGVAARSMGSWLRTRWGPRLYTIGQYEFKGQAVDNAREPYDIPAAPEGSLEERLSHSASDAFLVDVKRAAERSDGAWLRQPIAARYNGEFEERIVPQHQFDALLFLRIVSPPTFLY